MTGNRTAIIGQAASRRRAGGATLIATVFLIVVLGGVAGYLVLTASRSQVQPQQVLLAARAYQAARAGLEWGSYQAVVNGNGNPAACNSGGSFTPAGLTEFSVTVSCTSSIHRDSASDVRVFVITSTATAGTPGGLGYAYREMRATISPSAPL